MRSYRMPEVARVSRISQEGWTADWVGLASLAVGGVVGWQLGKKYPHTMAKVYGAGLVGVLTYGAVNIFRSYV